jgi:hypothetical protein
MSNISADKKSTDKISTDKIYNKINKLYSTAGYMDKYGSDVWTAAIICLSFIVFINYYYFVNILEVIKADWPAQRCNPLVMPFAGFINKPSDMSNLEFTAGNFNDCFNSILKNVVLVALQPLYFALDIMQEAVNGLITAFDKLRSLTSNLRMQFASIIKQIFAGITNLVVTFIGYTVKIKDSMSKINGILTVALYSLFGSYMAVVSLFLVMIDFILIILISICVAIIIFWLVAAALYFIPFFGVKLGLPFVIKAIIYTLIMIAILIPCIYFEVSLLRVMNLSTPSPPNVPSCFAGDTLIEMHSQEGEIYNKKHKPIKDIEIGDQLRNGFKVTGVMKFAAEEQNIYNLQGVFVTGEHRVYHPTLKWIKVKNHPTSVYIPDFNEPFVYCLNTDKKSFTIGETIFSDWDDIDNKVWEDLTKYCVVPGYLPENFSEEDIHTHLDSGFQATSKVTLHDGLKISVDNVKVNDVLVSGEKIVGVIKIAAHDMELFNYNFNNNANSICGSKNLHINDKNLGIINCMQIYKENEQILNQQEQFLYHFLTDTKFVTVNNIRFNDYNSGIDMYLREFN